MMIKTSLKSNGLWRSFLLFDSEEFVVFCRYLVYEI